jgi:hypothetical protein
MLLSLAFLQWIVLLFPAWVCVASGYILVAERRAARSPGTVAGTGQDRG